MAKFVRLDLDNYINMDLIEDVDMSDSSILIGGEWHYNIRRAVFFTILDYVEKNEVRVNENY